ncbi:hypothetical protein FDP41_000514 [Naegleria fowleri]|uniref:SHSP domain-containing protein n=1 Tax=Naegleria fowleri TaxID=5763 RepID=A0A6A5CH52_NAEFO|nr:uncharacterized protein FDP41_000514 [Naegleria fowleri]KAF0984615.1 hypothetical protein FDP41_000514 [Naegleria fowleri]CAG4711500.1 unnamed protein product [Naegleria fowleri]
MMRPFSTFFNDPTSVWFDSFFREDPLLSFMTDTLPLERTRQKQDTPKVYAPSTDVSENDKRFNILCNVPGLKKEDLKIDLDEEKGILTISGHIDKEKAEENETFHAAERFYGDISRSFKLPPKTVDFSGIKANLENGVLRVYVPKKEKIEKKKSIQIE